MGHILNLSKQQFRQKRSNVPEERGFIFFPFSFFSTVNRGRILAKCSVSYKNIVFLVVAGQGAHANVPTQKATPTLS